MEMRTPLAKKVLYPMPLGGVVEMFTGEAQTARFFDLCGEKWIFGRHSVRIGHNMKYVPDFYLPRLDLYVEVKNKHPLSVNPYDYEKMKLFAATGRSLYVMRKPTCVPSFVEADFEESHHIYYSSALLSGTEPNSDASMMVFQRGESGIVLSPFTDQDGFTLYDECMEALHAFGGE